MVCIHSKVASRAGRIEFCAVSMASSGVSTSTTSSSPPSSASSSSAPILTPSTIVAVILDAVRREVNSAVSRALAVSSSSTIVPNSISSNASGIHSYLKYHVF